MIFKFFYKPAVFLLTLTLLLSTACAPARDPDSTTPEVGTLSTHTPTSQPSRTILPASSQITLTPTPLLGPYICSPLKDVTLSQLSTILSNPFEMNRPGLDNGHHGVDFAFYRFGDHIGMAGLPIHSVMPGQVAATITDRPPYGNAIIIETPLAHLSQAWIKGLSLPEPGPFVEPQPATNCPDLSTALPISNGKNSLYLLYAHMQFPPTLTVGDRVSCGQEIGKVGTTGQSVNEHLHLETRVGPSSARFESMAYYDTSRTEEEAASYCIWRVSNIFHLFDPMDLLSYRTSPPSGLP